MFYDAYDLAYELLGAPCCFCGYNGPNYYQKHSHPKECPWHKIGGVDERIEALLTAAKNRRLVILSYAPTSPDLIAAGGEGFKTAP